MTAPSFPSSVVFRPLLAVGGLILALGQSDAQILLTNFESHAPGAEVMFQEPRVSGSTSAKLEATPNVGAVTTTFPAGNPNAGLQAYHLNYAFLANAADPLWVRLTTFNSANLPNPVISFTQPLSFDIYSDRPLYVALGLRETNSTGALGSNGGASGSIEFVGGTTDNAPNPPLGRLVPANTWTTLVFDIPNEPVRGFTGNGILESTTGKGVLEHIVLRSAVDGAAGTGQYNVYLDNVIQVPEPSTALLGLLGLGAVLRRRRA